MKGRFPQGRVRVYGWYAGQLLFAVVRAEHGVSLERDDVGHEQINGIVLRLRSSISRILERVSESQYGEGTRVLGDGVSAKRSWGFKVLVIERDQ